jgi:hypothetical protein
MMKFLLSRFLLIIGFSLFFGVADSRGQANPPPKKEAPLRVALAGLVDRKSTRLNSSHWYSNTLSRMPSSA